MLCPLVRKAIILKARYKILYDSVHKQGGSITISSLPVILSIYLFLVKRNFAMVIGMLHNIIVKCDVLLQKHRRDLSRFILFLSLMLVIGVL